MQNTRCFRYAGALLNLVVNMFTAKSRTSYLPRGGSLVQQEPKKRRRETESLRTAKLRVEQHQRTQATHHCTQIRATRCVVKRGDAARDDFLPHGICTNRSARAVDTKHGA